MNRMLLYKFFARHSNRRYIRPLSLCMSLQKGESHLTPY